jgi:hypothetical protein
MDLPREVLEGMGASNHWSAWQVAEETYKTHLLPLLDLISDALTTAYYLPALTAARVPNPDTYMLAFDGSTLIGQPDQLGSALELFDRNIISAEAVRTITSTPEDFAPAGDDYLRALAEKLVTNAPTLFAEPELRRRLGFVEAAVAVPKSASGIVPVAEPATPVPPGTPAATDSQVAAVPSRTASADFRAASLAVTYALERACRLSA